MSPINTIYRMPVTELIFDTKNARLVEFSEINSQTPEKRIIEILWEAMDVRELVLSIAASGYFENDPLIVSQENGRNIVIEGNRRLAAIRIILDPSLINAIIPEVTQGIKEKLREIPVMTSSREEGWRYFGFKHINGPAKWGSYAKAKYITQIHEDFNVPLDQIANQFGDTHKTIHKLYRGLMVLEQAERGKVFSRFDAKRSYFAFSHLYTSLQYPGISQFLNLKDENEQTKDFVPENKTTELGEVCKWLYGSKKENMEPVVQSETPNLFQLDTIVQNFEALAALRNGETIENAFELTKPVSNIFEEELLKSKRSLVKAKGLVTEGYDGSEPLLKVVESIANIAYDLHTEMERRKSPHWKRIQQDLQQVV